jgi:Skp family chaperone for outer membrane proteins
MIVTVALAATGIGVLGLATGHLTAQVPPPPPEEAPPAETSPEPEILVGTYRPQVAFQEHPAQKELQKFTEDIQPEMRQAQEEGDQRKMQQIQQQYEQARRRAVDEFQSDVDEAMPGAAENAGVKVVAMNVVYADDDVGTKDITPALIKAFQDKEEAEDETREPAPAPLPRMP